MLKIRLKNCQLKKNAPRLYFKANAYFTNVYFYTYNCMGEINTAIFMFCINNPLAIGLYTTSTFLMQIKYPQLLLYNIDFESWDFEQDQDIMASTLDAF